MTRRLLFIFLFYQTVVGFSQSTSDIPTAAEPGRSFDLSPGSLGALSSSVNLFTGDLNFPINLVSVPGHSGLGIDFTINYSSSNIENMFDIRNVELPTSTLGLGWASPNPKIIADNKQTGTREDDEFYLVEGGSPLKLIRWGTAGQVKGYRTSSFTNWRITYDESVEEWQIKKDNGNVYVFGNSASQRNTVQWTIKWGNWIGSSVETANQQEQAMIWDLSEVRNVFNQKVFYSYNLVEEQVGDNISPTPPQYTKASYPYKIYDEIGNEVEFFYQDKTISEYQDPHTEQAEPDAYQERYETRFLDKVVSRKFGIKVSEIRFEYRIDLLGTGEMTKRLLSKIRKFSWTDEEFPYTAFEYNQTNPMKGALKKVLSQLGGSVEFQYSPGIEAMQSERATSSIYSRGPSNRQEWIEDDYTLLTWYGSSGSNLLFKTLTWEGRWIDFDFPFISDIRRDGNNAPEFQVVTEKDFFAILKPTYAGNNYLINIYKRSQLIPGKWDIYSQTIDLGNHDTDREKLYAGDRFVAVTNNKNKLYTFAWEEVTQTWQASSIAETSGTRYSKAGRNYIVSQTKSPTTVNFHFLDEQGQWFTRIASDPFNNGDNASYWHCGDFFALVMVDGGNERIYQWDDQYNLLPNYNLGFGFPQDGAQVFINGSMISMASNTSNVIRVLRYNGVNWIDSGQKSVPYYSNCSFGDDYFLWEQNIASNPKVAYFKQYNPNWRIPMSGSEWGSDVNQNYSLPNTINGNPLEASSDFYLWLDQIRFRNTDGTWTAGTGYNGSNLSYSSFRNGNGFFAYDGHVQFIKNNTLANNVSLGVNFIGIIGVGLPAVTLLRGQTIFGYVGSFNTDGNYQNNQQINIHRAINFGVSGRQIDYPVIRIITNDGSTSTYTSFAYDASTATFNQSGTSANYNKVYTIPGSDNSTLLNGKPVTRPLGYAVNYFFNGVIDLNNCPDAPNCGPPEEAGFGNATTSYKMLNGQLYRTISFSGDTNPSIVSDSRTLFSVDFDTYTNGGYTVRPKKQIAVTGGIKSVVEYDYDAYETTTKQLKSSTSYLLDASNSKFDEIKNEVVYWWEKYDVTRNNLILGSMVQSKSSKNGTVVESQVTRYTSVCQGGSFNFEVFPFEVYKWKRSGSSDFSQWNSSQSVSSSDWKFISQSSVDFNGRQLESSNSVGLKSCGIWHSTLPIILAKVSNAQLSQVFYEGFEYSASNTSSDAKAGVKSYTTSFVVPAFGGPSILTYWKKPAGGAWQLISQPTTGASITIGGGGALIDEVRVHPSNAFMTTYSYDNFGNLITEVDPHNNPIYYEYDGLYRNKLVRDQDSNIVEVSKYNTKN